MPSASRLEDDPKTLAKLPRQIPRLRGKYGSGFGDRARGIARHRRHLEGRLQGVQPLSASTRELVYGRDWRQSPAESRSPEALAAPAREKLASVPFGAVEGRRCRGSTTIAVTGTPAARSWGCSSSISMGTSSGVESGGGGRVLLLAAGIPVAGSREPAHTRLPASRRPQGSHHDGARLARLIVFVERRCRGFRTGRRHGSGRVYRGRLPAWPGDIFLASRGGDFDDCLDGIRFAAQVWRRGRVGQKLARVALGRSFVPRGGKGPRGEQRALRKSVGQQRRGLVAERAEVATSAKERLVHPEVRRPDEGAVDTFVSLDSGPHAPGHAECKLHLEGPKRWLRKRTRRGPRSLEEARCRVEAAVPASLASTTAERPRMVLKIFHDPTRVYGCRTFRGRDDLVQRPGSKTAGDAIESPSGTRDISRREGYLSWSGLHASSRAREEEPLKKSRYRQRHLRIPDETCRRSSQSPR